MPNSSSVQLPTYSKKYSYILIISFIIEVITWGIALNLFIQAYIGAYQDNFTSIHNWFEFRSQLVEYSLIWIVVRLFTFAWHWYFILIDLRNRFPDESFNPSLGFVWVLIPFANVVMYGYNQFKTINTIDFIYHTNAEYHALSIRLKIALGMFYAGILGTVLTIPQVMSFPSVMKAQMQVETIIFTGVQFLFMAGWIIGFCILTVRWQKMIRMIDKMQLTA